MLLFVVPVFGVAMGVYLCCALLWAFRLVVSVRSGSSTVYIVL